MPDVLLDVETLAQVRTDGTGLTFSSNAVPPGDPPSGATLLLLLPPAENP